MSIEKKSKKASFSFHPDTYNLLEEVAEHLRIPKSTVLALALQEFFERHASSSDSWSVLTSAVTQAKEKAKEDAEEK